MTRGKHRKRGRVSNATKLPIESSSPTEQSGDLQGLNDDEEADSESVRELVEEGQSLEAGLIDSVENSPDSDVAEVTTREVPEDDVPPEYLSEH